MKKRIGFILLLSILFAGTLTLVSCKSYDDTTNETTSEKPEILC